VHGAALTEILAVKTLKAGLLLAVLGFGLFQSCEKAPGNEPSWQTDLTKAQEEAKAGHKLLLVDFTGSDWCGWCKLLHREVFSRKEFQEYARQNLVLLEIDFPRFKPQSEALKRQNLILAERYRIEMYPTIVLLSADGKKVGQLGYIEGGPSAFIAELEKIRKS
jgi:protein disulfide-isomerase